MCLNKNKHNKYKYFNKHNLLRMNYLLWFVDLKNYEPDENIGLAEIFVRLERKYETEKKS